jgi:hypothetical protein
MQNLIKRFQTGLMTGFLTVVLLSAVSCGKEKPIINNIPELLPSEKVLDEIDATNHLHSPEYNIWVNAILEREDELTN